MTILRACATCGKPSPAAYCSEHTPKPWASSKRAERVGLSGGKWQGLREIVLKRDSGTCYLCGRIVREAAEVDHLVPVADGGSNALTNLATAHPACHRRRHREPDWAAERVEAALRVIADPAGADVPGGEPRPAAASSTAAVARRGRAERTSE